MSLKKKVIQDKVEVVAISNAVFTQSMKDAYTSAQASQTLGE